MTGEGGLKECNQLKKDEPEQTVETGETRERDQSHALPPQAPKRKPRGILLVFSSLFCSSFLPTHPCSCSMQRASCSCHEPVKLWRYIMELLYSNLFSPWSTSPVLSTLTLGSLFSLASLLSTGPVSFIFISPLPGTQSCRSAYKWARLHRRTDSGFHSNPVSWKRPKSASELLQQASDLPARKKAEEKTKGPSCENKTRRCGRWISPLI